MVAGTKRRSRGQRSRSMRLRGLRGRSGTINQLLARRRRARPRGARRSSPQCFFSSVAAVYNELPRENHAGSFMENQNVPAVFHDHSTPSVQIFDFRGGSRNESALRSEIPRKTEPPPEYVPSWPSFQGRVLL